ncbi:IclR family transcriptional regulator [Halobellus rarus]|uniref:IclR family transcriptional regulator n=1 Tax=Halobellus rarus TaxID=1126237 RepID=A0ABD6CSW3_9EURY
MAKNDRTVKSDATLFAIIEELVNLGSGGATEIANELNISKSTVHRHLKTLETYGYAVNRDGKYELSVDWFHWGIQVRSNQALYKAAKQELTNLAEETGLTVWCGVERDGRILYIAGKAKDPVLDLDTVVGFWNNLHTTACGKAILAHLPEARIKEIFDNRIFSNETTYNNVDEKDLRYELELIRMRGYSTNIGEDITGIYGVGAPIIIDNRVVGGISIGDSMEGIQEYDIKNYSEQIKRAASRIEEIMAK